MRVCFPRGDWLFWGSAGFDGFISMVSEWRKAVDTAACCVFGRHWLEMAGSGFLWAIFQPLLNWDTSPEVPPSCCICFVFLRLKDSSLTRSLVLPFRGWRAFLTGTLEPGPRGSKPCLHCLEAVGPQTSHLSSLAHFPHVKKQFTVQCAGMAVRSKQLTAWAVWRIVLNKSYIYITGGEGKGPTPGFLPGDLHGQRSVTGYGPWGCKEADSTEVT